MKLTNKLFIIASLSLVFAGCGDFLEPNSKSEFVPKDATSLNELLLGEAYQRNDLGGFNTFLALLDDDVEAAPYQVPMEDFKEDKYLASFSWQPDMFSMMEKANAGHTNIYEKYYELILGANAVLDYLPKVTDTEEMINIVKAQALALRGFYYFNLVNIFGQPYNHNREALGVPLKLQSGIEESDDYLQRKTVEEVYAQILMDLHAAEEIYKLLPEEQQWKPKFRTSLPMVQLMLSRTYLYMENWAMAAEYAEQVMNNRNFRLLDLNNVSSTAAEYMYYPTYDSPETIWPYGSPEDMFAWTCQSTNSANPNNGNKKMHAYFQASEELKSTFDEFDLRLKRYIIKAPVENSEYMDMAYGKILVGTQYYLPKNAIGVFGRCLRLSEAYLNFAEAQANMGGDGIEKAAEALTALREKRYDPEDDFEVEITDQQELIEFIKKERRRELCFEGHRWFDLRRWGMPEITHVWHTSSTESHTYRLTEKDLMYTVPIPDEAMQENSKLVQNELPGKRTYEKK
ncbi:MAG: RagB/SusD family nutrient uptake outer membrane protein [Bacteroidaceae bacterium]|nr:RagB/SusD family nutrient uptake outer membrane protein [Bacteroidaceae bacterium]